nr:PREDICTED: uncharacterized protein LOC100557596 [Anolis carolinensis]|eukprot:XP_016853776.1 PREDICTED: uncharacterized protein LOC100557596 [Anolis carolinensis]
MDIDPKMKGVQMRETKRIQDLEPMNNPHEEECLKDLGLFPLQKRSRVCGRRPVAVSHGNLLYRLRGTNALPGTWPWAVSFQFLTRKGYRHFCSGALISSQWVLSAAHCFQIKSYIQTEYWRVLIGATIQSKPGLDSQARSIKRLVMHQQYQRLGHNDIALIELDQPVACNDFIQLACLPDEHIIFTALTHCYIGGWGVLEREKTIKYTDILQESKVSLISNENCNTYEWNNTKIKDDNICAVGESKSVDRCQGDGGSPLMCRPPRSERFWVIGINSWVTNCLYKHRPGVFTSTKSFSVWINHVMQQPPKVALVPPFKTTTRSQKERSWEMKPYLVFYQDELGNGFSFYFLGPTPPDATVLYLTKTPPSWAELDLTLTRRTTASPFLSQSQSRPTLPWTRVTYPPYINTAGQKEWQSSKSLGWRRRHHAYDHGHWWRTTKGAATTEGKRRRLVKHWTNKLARAFFSEMSKGRKRQDRFILILWIRGRRPLAPHHVSSPPRRGGFDTMPGAWPWIVSLQLPTITGHKHSCGGSLVSARWILTAAHCFSNKRNLPHWRAVIGASKLSSLGPEVHVRFIKQVVIHEDYKPPQEANDIALMELDQPVKCSDYIQPACMPNATTDVDKFNDCFISGWGVLRDIGFPNIPTLFLNQPSVLPSPEVTVASDVMREAKVNRFAPALCNSSNWYNGAVEPNTICAGYAEGGVDSCQGDSGGPLMCKENESQPFWVIGTTSWGKGCGEAHHPGVYTSTQSFHEWIEKHIGPMPEPLPERKPARPRRPTEAATTTSTTTTTTTPTTTTTTPTTTTTTPTTTTTTPTTTTTTTNYYNYHHHHYKLQLRPPLLLLQLPLLLLQLPPLLLQLQPLLLHLQPLLLQLQPQPPRRTTTTTTTQRPTTTTHRRTYTHTTITTPRTHSTKKSIPVLKPRTTRPPKTITQAQSTTATQRQTTTTTTPQTTTTTPQTTTTTTTTPQTTTTTTPQTTTTTTPQTTTTTTPQTTTTTTPQTTTTTQPHTTTQATHKPTTVEIKLKVPSSTQPHTTQATHKPTTVEIELKVPSSTQPHTTTQATHKPTTVEIKLKVPSSTKHQTIQPPLTTSPKTTVEILLLPISTFTPETTSEASSRPRPRIPETMWEPVTATVAVTPTATTVAITPITPASDTVTPTTAAALQAPQGAQDLKGSKDTVATFFKLLQKLLHHTKKGKNGAWPKLTEVQIIEQVNRADVEEQTRPPTTPPTTTHSTKEKNPCKVVEETHVVLKRKCTIKS